MNISDKYTLSICIPTYHRPNELIKQLSLIGKQWDALGGMVQVIVSDNSYEKEHTVKKGSIESLGYPIEYVLNNKNIGYQDNLMQLLTLASGKYVWFLSDDDFLKDESVNRIVKILRESQEISYLTFDHEVSVNNKVVEKGNFFKSLAMDKCIYDGDFFLENYLHSVVFLSINIFNRRKFFEYYESVKGGIPKNATYQNSIMLIPYISNSRNVLVIPEALIVESSGDKIIKPEVAIRGNYEYLHLFVQLKSLLKGRAWLKNFEADFAKNYKLSTLIYTFTTAYTDENFNFSQLYYDSFFHRGCTPKMRVLILKLWFFYKFFSRSPKLLKFLAEIRGQSHAWLYYREKAQEWIKKINQSKIHTSYAVE